MNKEDQEFRKKCRDTHQKVQSLLRKENMSEVSYIMAELEQSVKNWTEYERSVIFRARLIKGLYADLSRKQRIKTSSIKSQEAKNE